LANGSGNTSAIRLIGTSGTHYVCFENVNVMSTATPYAAVSTQSGSSNIVNATFNNCVFDYTSAPTKCYMFGSGNAGIINANVVNCKIIADENSGFSLLDSSKNSIQALAYYTGTPADTIKYEGNNVLLLAKGTTAPASKTNNLEFVYSRATTYNEVEYDEYEIAEKTAYGNIPAQYADDKMVVFKADKTCVGGYETFNEAAKAAGLVSSRRASDCVILFRGDYTHEKIFNISNYIGSVIIDLNGYTVTLGTSNCSFLFLVDITHADADNPATITVKNGNFVLTTTSGGTSVARLNGTSGAHHVYFENVKIKSKATPYVAVSTQGTSKNVINATFTDCVFDYADNSSKCYMFGSNTAGQINATMSNCKIIGSSKIPMNIILPTNSGTTHALAFYAGTPADTLKYEGRNMLLLAKGTVAPTAKTNNLEFVYSTTTVYNGAEYDVYEIAEKHSYGNIPAHNTNVDEYPILLFKADKTFVGGYKTFADAIAAAGLVADYKATEIKTNASEVDGADCVILLRKASHTLSKVTDYVANYYNNITIDLGGNTVISKTDKMAFLKLTNTEDYAENKVYGTITIKNGIFDYQAGGSDVSVIRSNGAVGSYTINFDRVTIKSTNTKSTGRMYSAISTSGASKANQIVNSEFTNCVFDYTEAQAKYYLFGSGNNLVGGVINATLVDCEILAGSNNGIVYIDTTNATQALAYYPGTTNDTLKIVNNIKFTLKEGVAAPAASNVWKTAEGVECVFVKSAENDGYVNYSLYPKVMVGYKIKTSVTLWSNFVYNIYIPKANVNSFTVNGATMEYEEVELDGVTYYHVAVNLPAGETLQDIKVSVKLNSGATTVDANWTLNVLNYTKSVIGGNYDNTTKTLMKDMLVYASAAHTYFENTEAVSAKLSEIATLLEGYTKEMPTGEAKKPTDTTYFKDVTVNLDKVPSFIFTLADGYTADNFTFKVGNRNATVIKGEGYVEIVMYAYMMLDDVTFTVNGTEVTESYNLYAYYEYAKTLNNANLTAIVEALMKYSASAAAYRESVIN